MTGGSGGTLYPLVGLIDIGQVAKNATALIPIWLVNSSSSDITVTNVTPPGGVPINGFGWNGSLAPWVVPAGETMYVGDVKFLSATLGVFSQDIDFFFGTSSVARVYLIAECVEDTTAINITPSVISFPDTKVGNSSPYQEIRVTNVGGFAITITAVTPAADFEMTAGPALPCTLKQNEYANFYVRFKPSGGGTYNVPHGVTIASNVPGSPAYVLLAGMAYVSDPSAVLTGADSKALFAFAQGDVVSLAAVATKIVSANDLNCEEVQRLEKATNFGTPGISKSLHDIFVRYEDKGAASYIMQALTRTQNIWKSVNIGTAQADDAPLSAKSENVIEGEVIDLILYRSANSGPMSIIDFICRVEDAIVLMGTTPLPTELTSHIALLGTSPQTLFAFATGAGVPVIKTSGGAIDLNCEEPQHIKKTTNLGIQGLEKMLASVWVKCEDFGPANLILDTRTKRDTHLGNAHGLTSVGGNGDIVSLYLDDLITDELIEVTLRRIGGDGALSITEMLVKVEPKGEVVENI